MRDDQLTKTICAKLSEVVGWVWQPDGPEYSGGQVGIHYGRIRGSLDRGIAVRVYASDDDLRTGLAQRSVQLYFRGRRDYPDDADTMASVAFEHLQGLSRTGGINGISRRSMAPLGVDESDRELRSDNYTVILDNPEA